MHVNDYECILYLTRFGLSEEKRQELQQHFLLCDECHQKIEYYTGLIAKSNLENETECRQIENELVDYKMDEIDKSRKEKIDRHLGECEKCRYLFDRLNLYESEAEDSVEIKTRRTSKKEELLSHIKAFRDKIGSLISITLEPLQPAPAFLGKDKTEISHKIKHTGGDILVHLNKAGQKATLLSNDNRELDRRKSDEVGMVIFDDFLPGEYQIKVPGAQISKLVQQK